MSRAEKVCIVGPDFASDQLDGGDPLDQYYTAGNHRFRIIGVLQEDVRTGLHLMGSWERSWDLKAIYIPLKTGAVYFKQNMALDFIYMQAKGSDSFAEMQNHARQVLLVQHNMEKDFSFQDTGAEMLEFTGKFEDLMKKWSMTLLAIATISLLVGGIGLFSTLLISINERMMEIGIRKSIGARNVDIFFYFIVEALILSFLAASIGIILGYLITFGLGAVIKIQVPLSPLSVYVGLAFAFVIGFLSGLYPALKAANINPIQAIYYFD
jgi:putative ABC transport system permease protein